MSFNVTETFVPSHLLAAAYGEGAYNCGPYEVGCNTSTGVKPPDTSVATILNEPSIVLPGSLILAVIIALITTSIAKLWRKSKTSKQ